MTVTRQVRALALSLMLCLGLIFVSGCSPEIDVRGSAPSDEDLVTVRRGIDTKKDIQERFGTPITLSTSDPNLWYYVSQTLRPRPLNPPEVLDQRIVLIFFDTEELVLNYEIVNGLIGDTELRPHPASSEIYGPDRSAVQSVINTIFGSIGLTE